jgi:hypothetical protein
MLVLGRRHLEVVLAEFVEQYSPPESTNPGRSRPSSIHESGWSPDLLG